jgi:hypothetical protein
MSGQLKTILVHVDLSRHAPSRIRMAASVAQVHGATLLGAAMTGISRAVFPHGYDASRAPLTGSHFDPLVDNARWPCPGSSRLSPKQACQPNRVSSATRRTTDWRA